VLKFKHTNNVHVQQIRKERLMALWKYTTRAYVD